ncbi:MAG: class I SAM-dependent methyltransferase [Candidatus Omnitrophota bacterium]
MSKLEESLSLEAINKHFIKEAQKPISYTRTYFWWKKFQKISSLFQKEVKIKKEPLRIIDIGCGLGSNIFHLNQDFGKENNLEFYGVDLDPSRVYYCNLKKEEYQTKNTIFNIDNAECLNFPNNNFDILLSIEVLEHLRNPERAINEFYRILKPEGLAIITTPNQSTLILRLKKLLRPLFLKSWKINSDYPKEIENPNFGLLGNSHSEIAYGHISVRSLNEWIRIFRDCKFKVEEIKRGALLFGTPQQDKRRTIFALVLLIEILLDKLFFLKNLSEDVIISLRKV